MIPSGSAPVGSVLLPGRNIVLIGMMGAGKSTVGRLLARRLARPFADTDELVEAHAGRSLPEVFAIEGERGFRSREAGAVRLVSALRGQVIAVGGGAVLDPGNVTHLRATGDLVLLEAPAQTLAERVAGGNGRPLLAGAGELEGRLSALQQERGSAYASAAAHRVATGGRSPEEIAEAVLEWARTRPGLLTREERTL